MKLSELVHKASNLLEGEWIEAEILIASDEEGNSFSKTRVEDVGLSANGNVIIFPYEEV